MNETVLDRISALIFTALCWFVIVSAILKWAEWVMQFWRWVQTNDLRFP